MDECFSRWGSKKLAEKIMDFGSPDGRLTFEQKNPGVTDGLSRAGVQDSWTLAQGWLIREVAGTKFPDLPSDPFRGAVHLYIGRQAGTSDSARIQNRG